ncbi:MAG: hypothetical protein HPY68_01695 [Candidatus Atribacteria bacterium]|nr:hypothetical protein [Candidatus Atribacteria bacterium]
MRKMEKEKEKMREVFEEFFFGPMERVFGPFLNEEARKHLSQAKLEVLKAMRSFIDTEIERMEKRKQQE